MKSITLKKQFVLLFFAFLFSFFALHAQNVAINNTGATANPAAMLDVSSTTSGFLPPRMTTAQMNAIASPVSGLQVFNTTTNCLMFYVNGSWQNISCACITPPTTPGAITGNSNPCFDSSGNAYSIAALVGASSYTWTVPVGDTITSGQGTPYITVSIPGINYIRQNGTYGDITVTASNTCGTSAAQSFGGTYIDTSAMTSFNNSNPTLTNSSISFLPTNTVESSYSWAFQNGNPSTSTAQNSIVSWSTPGTYTISLSVTSGSGCTYTAIQSITISTLSNGQAFSYTGSKQTFTVPSGVTSITIQAFGAQGVTSTGSSPGVGGPGGYATGTLTVSAGQTLNIYVGGQSGWNGGGNGGVGGNCVIGNGGFGGDASDVRLSGTALSNRIIVAGGGGGGGGAGNCSFAAGGTGGTGGGATGGTGTMNYSTGAGGNGGTQSSGGTGGSGGGCGSGNNGGNGTLGVGGNGNSVYAGGGGGGGGYYGGGGGSTCSSGGGGGGGSSYIGGVTNGSTTSGIEIGNGAVIITW